MKSEKLAVRSGVQLSDGAESNDFEAGNNSPDNQPLDASARRLPAWQATGGASARQLRQNFPGGFHATSTREEKKSDVGTKRELEVKPQSEETSLLEKKSHEDVETNPEDLEKFRPTQQVIEAAWQEIVKNNIRDSKKSKVDSMTKDEIESCETAYIENVATWLGAEGALSQIKQQQVDLQHQPITKDAMLPGDILLRKESPPQSVAHATTLKFQTKQNLNGIEPNNGDHNIFHAALWIGDKSDRTMDTSKEIAEARGGLGTTNAMRVLAHSIQTGQYWVYRLRPEYGLPQDACKEIFDLLPSGETSTVDGALLAKVASLFAEFFAGMKERYSATALSTSMRADSEFSKLTPARVQDAIRLAANPSAMSHVGPTSDTEFFREIRTRENAMYNQNKGVTRKGGDSCSTLIPRVLQTAALQIAAFNAIQKLINDTGGNPLDDEARKKIASNIAPTEDGEINDFFKELFAKTLNDIGGLLAKNAEGIAPKTIEHFCRDKNNFDFVGVLTVAPNQVLREEMHFDKDGNSVEPPLPSVDAEHNDCCTIL